MIAVFGTLFNDIVINRKTNDGTEIHKMRIPIAYGPHQKFLARIQQDPDLDAPSITLPRMSFEIVGMVYDGERKLPSRHKISVPSSANNAIFNTAYTPVPYNLDVELVIMAKYSEDGTKILEQILPFFKPDFTPSVQLLDGIDYYMDIPIILNGTAIEDVYDGDFAERRALMWTLTFTIKGWYYGPVTANKIIKFARVNTYTDSLTANAEIIVTAQPGLLANGSPTTDIDETISYTLINEEDDWDYIVTIEEP